MYRVLQLFILTAVVVLGSQDAPEVKVQQGVLRGKIEQTRKGKSFNSFTAIPYAKPPVGELRFKPPVAAEPWEGILDTTKLPSVCPQTNILLLDEKLIGDEDCLYLNVYTPQDSQGKSFPVLFYIHGGGWFTGSGNTNYHGPKLLLEKDVILVTINYRLGPLGFFTTGDKHVIGNDGLKDQALAIKWVKDNIASFGGDPDSITLFGQSAGGANVHYHMVSPMSRDLISGAIAQSGTALTIWALIPHFLSTRRSKMLAGELGCPTYVTEELMECLRKVDAYEIIKATSIFAEWGMDPMMPFGLVIEPKVPGAFLPEDPIATIKSGKAANIPFMTGITSEEGGMRIAALFMEPDLVKELDDNFNKLSGFLLQYRDVATYKYRETIGADIRKFYFGDLPIDDSTKPQLIKMQSDATLLAGADAAVELHAKFSKKSVYYYLFGFRGSASFCSLFAGSSSYDYGVCHCDDLLYLFDSELFYPDYVPTESDEKVTELMTTLWTNFAKYGNPTSEADSSISVKWEPVQNKKQNYYFIKKDGDVELDVNLYKERTEFWRNLPITSRRDLIRDEL